MIGTKLRSVAWVHYVVRKGEIVNTWKTVVRKEKGKRPFGRPKRRCEDNMRTDRKETRLWTELI